MKKAYISYVLHFCLKFCAICGLILCSLILSLSSDLKPFVGLIGHLLHTHMNNYSNNNSNEISLFSFCLSLLLLLLLFLGFLILLLRFVKWKKRTFKWIAHEMRHSCVCASAQCSAICVSSLHFVMFFLRVYSSSFLRLLRSSRLCNFLK